MSYLSDDFKTNREELDKLRIARAMFQNEIAWREDAGIDFRAGINTERANNLVAPSVTPPSGQRGGSVCICQNAYNTGFTGVRAIDERLQYHYEWWIETDAIKRDYDHYAFGIPYVEHSARRPYCFEERRPMRCNHRACEHARHRAPDTVKRMRWHIESVCPAHIHYPELVERIDRSGDTRPEMDNNLHLAAQWDELQYRFHRFGEFGDPADPRKWQRDETPTPDRPELSHSPHPRPFETSQNLRCIPIEEFTDVLYPVVEAEAIGQFLQHFTRPLNNIPAGVLDYDQEPVTISFNPAVLAEQAANEAAEALFADHETYAEKFVAGVQVLA